MQAISATDPRHKLSTILDVAQAEPVVIRRDHHDVAVMLSAAEYHRLRNPWQSHASITSAHIDRKLAELLDSCD